MTCVAIFDPPPPRPPPRGSRALPAQALSDLADLIGATPSTGRKRHAAGALSLKPPKATTHIDKQPFLSRGPTPKGLVTKSA